MRIDYYGKSEAIDQRHGIISWKKEEQGHVDKVYSFLIRLGWKVTKENEMLIIPVEDKYEFKELKEDYQKAKNYMMISEEDIKKRIEEHNQAIDDYINNKLAKELGAVDGKIPVNLWFKAQELISKQGFHGKALTLLKELRQYGYDVKINMQSNTLEYYGKRKELEF